MRSCFALLEDAAEPSRCRLYTDFCRSLRCDDAAGFPQLLAEMQAALAVGEHAVALFSYELGAAQHGIAAWPAEKGRATPFAEVLLFRRFRRISGSALEAWLDCQAAAEPSAAPAHIVNLRAGIDRAAFDSAIGRIHDYLAAGDCYQVNYTWRLRFDALGAPAALYRKLRMRQPTRYGALIVLPDGRAVVSCSPELFMRHHEGRLGVQPMKGTAAADGDADIDRARGEALAADPKNRAENLMIVDLLRNDLGRVAQAGTVRAEALFRVERFGRVLQMTSTVTAQARADADPGALLTALFPCGSITGAPKLRAMQIIRELETAPRGLYTGALGWFDPPAAGRAVGDFCLSVPIRTLTLDTPRDGRRTGVLGVGAGIVYDSVAAEEFEECHLKARFLTGLAADFSLFETVHASHRRGCRRLSRHLARLRHSAAQCGFAYDETVVRAALEQALRTARAQLPQADHLRVRLTLAQDGTAIATAAALPALTEPVKVFIAGRACRSAPFFLAHKTTFREDYDAAWRAAEARGGFDQLFFNADGELTEGGRCNVFVQIDGRWTTPPLAAGVLPGIMRAVLLEDPAWAAVERRLTPADLRRAQQVVVCNALRGAMRAEIDWSGVD